LLSSFPPTVSSVSTFNAPKFPYSSPFRDHFENMLCYVRMGTNLSRQQFTLYLAVTEEEKMAELRAAIAEYGEKVSKVGLETCILILSLGPAAGARG